MVGWVNHQNIGDEAYKICFPKLFPDHSFHFSEKLPKTNNPAILGGGNVCASPFLDQIEKAKKKFAISVGCIASDPIIRMKMFDKIFVRDEDSLNYLKQLEINAKLIPDLAFSLHADKNHGKKLIEKLFTKQSRDLYQKVIGIVFNAFLCVGENRLARDEATFQKVTWDIARTLDNTNASFIFIPFGQSQPHDDRVANAWLASRCKFWKKNLVIFDNFNVQETLNLIAGCNCVISTRLHSSIFSTISSIPFIDITHHAKNSGFLRSIYKQDWSIPYWDFDRRRFADMLNEFIEGNGDYGLSKIVAAKRFILAGLNQEIHFV